MTPPLVTWVVVPSVIDHNTGDFLAYRWRERSPGVYEAELRWVPAERVLKPGDQRSYCATVLLPE